jgi:hypothetical protein
MCNTCQPEARPRWVNGDGAVPRAGGAIARCGAAQLPRPALLPPPLPLPGRGSAAPVRAARRRQPHCCWRQALAADRASKPPSPSAARSRPAALLRPALPPRWAQRAAGGPGQGQRCQCRWRGSGRGGRGPLGAAGALPPAAAPGCSQHRNGCPGRRCRQDAAAAQLTSPGALGSVCSGCSCPAAQPRRQDGGPGPCAAAEQTGGSSSRSSRCCAPCAQPLPPGAHAGAGH